MEVNLVPAEESRFTELEPTSQIEMTNVIQESELLDPPNKISDPGFDEQDSNFRDEHEKPNTHTK